MSKTLVTKKIRNRLKLNAVLTLGLVLTGSVFFISAFATEGTRFDLYEFCFKPTNLKNPKSASKFCGKSQVYRGVTWLVAREYENSTDFKKVSLIRGLKADRPDTGWIGLISAFFFLGAWLTWKEATLTYTSELHKLIREKERDILEFALLSDKDFELIMRQTKLEAKYEAEIQDRTHADAISDLKPDWEKKALREKALEQQETASLERELHNETLRAETEEQRKIRYEAAVAALKAKSKIDNTDPWEEEKKDILTKESLKLRLQEHEGGWLWELVDNKKPLWVVGGQGSWKSNFASTIAMCRYIFNGWKIVSITDPHMHQNRLKDAPWYNLIRLEPECYGQHEDGTGFNWESIEESIEACFKRWKERSLQSPIVVSIWDEVSSYSDNVNSSDGWALRINTDPRKANEAMILLAHGKTQRMTGGGKGTSEAKEENCIFLKLGSNNKGLPTFKGYLEGWKNEEGDIIEEMKITIPKDWFNPITIGELLT